MMAISARELLVVALLFAAGCESRSTGNGQTTLSTVGSAGAETATKADSESADWSVPMPTDLGTAQDPRIGVAVNKAVEVIRANPESAVAVGQLGHVYQAHRWEEQAAICYRRAMELAPDDYRWYYFLGRSLEVANPKEAAQLLAKCLEMKPKFAAAHFYCARALRLTGNNELATEHFRMAVQLDPSDSLSEQALGELELAAGRLEAARDHLLKALQINPEQSEAHGALARVYLGLGEVELAKGHQTKAESVGRLRPVVDALWMEVQNAGVTIDWYAARGAILLHQRRFDEALDELRQAVSPEQDDPRFWLNYGICLEHAQMHQDSADALSRALTAQPSHKDKQLTDLLRCEVLVNLGIANSRLLNTQASLENFQQAQLLVPHSIEAANNLAIFHYKQGDVSQAVELLTRFQEQYPNTKSQGILQLLRQEASKQGPSDK